MTARHVTPDDTREDTAMTDCPGCDTCGTKPCNGCRNYLAGGTGEPRHGCGDMHACADAWAARYPEQAAGGRIRRRA